MKNLKKFLALALSASMVMGMTLTSMAAEPEVSVDAPIYIYDITNIVVPTTFAVGFNPDGLSVTKGDETVNDQIVAKNYGIINKSTKDKIITVTLKVEDLNDHKINLVSKDYIESSTSNGYDVNLQVVPAAGEVKIGEADADLDTTGADLADVTMTSATSAAKDLMEGENEIEFLLEKAKFTGSINIDTQTTNDVNSSFTPSSLADAGKGITAFTFKGSMNANADWSKLTKGIKITAVYGNENASDDAASLVVSGTGAMYVNPNPVFKTGTEVGTIKYRTGTSATDALASITKVEMEWGGKAYDGYISGGRYWDAATDSDGLITLSTAYIKFCADGNPDDTTRPATITYETVSGETKIAIVEVKVRQPIYKGPVFTAGTAVGLINYTTGTGDDALVSISKIEMEWNGIMYDGYNSGGKYWTAATDSNGLVTLAAAYVKNCADVYTSDTTRPATITYVTSGGETKTATIDVKIR